jgi:CDP-diacylglycerol--glycerol-3-phosphate 3-phosphatidyltransferase
MPGDGRHPLREELTNLPNLLTYARIAAIPVVLWMMWAETPAMSFLASVVFSLAAITDWLDGYLARKRGQESILGKLLDPLADKLIVMATLVVAVELGRVPGWFVVLLLSRELAVSGLRSIASQEGLVVEVVQAGKWKTALQLTGLVVVLIHYPYRIDFLVAERVVDFGRMGFALLLLSMSFSLVSAGTYFHGFLRAIARAGAAPRDS